LNFHDVRATAQGLKPAAVSTQHSAKAKPILATNARELTRIGIKIKKYFFTRRDLFLFLSFLIRVHSR
jgi:hypothetical protein